MTIVFINAHRDQFVVAAMCNEAADSSPVIQTRSLTSRPVHGLWHHFALSTATARALASESAARSCQMSAPVCDIAGDQVGRCLLRRCWDDVVDPPPSPRRHRRLPTAARTAGTRWLCHPSRAARNLPE